MKILRFIVIFLFSLFTISLSAQTKKELEETYKDANSYFYFEDYEEALALFLQVYKHQPSNSNLCYKIGFCYLNIPGSKDKSIEYLAKASLNTTKIYNEESIVETKAPIDAIFYLGNAYFINNQINNALAEYKRFENLTKGKGQWNLDYFNHQIVTAKNSLSIQKTPVNFLQVNLGGKINDRFANYNPAISGDGKTLVYTTKQRFYQAILVSNLGSNGEWSTPKNITLDLQVDGNCSSLSLSYDGKELYLFKDDNHDGNIYVSHFKNDNWSPMVILNKNINSESYETHACISSDGKYMYFTSNRKGGYGDLDIYVSERSAGDNWGVPRNLGSTVNTNFNENTPFLSNDGKTLYFSSEGHNNMGGYDIFITQFNSKGEWTTPINLGYPLNTTDDNLFFHPIGNGSKGLIATFDTDGYGDQDINEVELFIPKFMKNIVSSTSYSERILDNTYRKIVIDTINTSGIALLDINYSNIPLRIDPQKRYKLFFDGKSYDIREKVKLAERINAKTDKIQANALVINSEVVKTSENDSSIINPVQDRINLLKQFSDTNAKSNIINRNLTDSQLGIERDLKIGTVSSIENNNLSEILLMLAPLNSQSILTRILKNEWKFEANRLNEKVIEFSEAFETYQEKDAMLLTLATFADKLGNLGVNTPKKRSKNISTNTPSNTFYYYYNQLINKASPELSKILATTLVNSSNTLTIEDLLLNFKQSNPEGYKEHLPELLRIMTQSAIGTYLSLSDEQKFNIYNNISQTGDEKNSNWWLYIIIAFVLTSALGYYAYSRKEKQ